jgi:hypothetical protein
MSELAHGLYVHLAMRTTRSLPSAAVLGAAVLLLGCATDGDDYGDTLGDDLEEGADGKADGEANVVVTSHDLALYSAPMKTLLCGAIADSEPAFDDGSARTSFLSRCAGFSFRVREQARSTLYGGLGTTTPLTIWLSVAVTGEGDTWITKAERLWNPETFAFDWRGSVAPTSDPIHAHIEAIADDPEGHYDDLRLRSFRTMPAAIKTAANTWIAERHAALLENSSEDPDTISVEVGSEENASLLLDGTVVGYRVEVWLTQGNGDGAAFLYYDKNAELVVEWEEWF